MDSESFSIPTLLLLYRFESCNQSIQVMEGPEITFLLTCLVGLSRIFVQPQLSTALCQISRHSSKIDGPECLLPIIHFTSLDSLFPKASEHGALLPSSDRWHLYSPFRKSFVLNSQVHWK